MNKSIKYFACSLMMGAAVVSCGKDDGKTDGPGNEPETPTETIVIDGNFADWDAVPGIVSATLPDGVKENAALKTIKFTADDDYIYGYVQYENHLKALKGVDPSWDGNGAWRIDGKTCIPTPLRVFFDCDNNPKTGMMCGNCFTKIGAEIAMELYEYMAVETGKVELAWSQCNIMNVEKGAEDGDDFNDGTPPQKWGDDGNGNRDNTLVLKNDFKAKVTGKMVEVEFAVSKSAMDELTGDTVNISVQFMGCDSGPDGGFSQFGYLPQGGDKQYISLKLK